MTMQHKLQQVREGRMQKQNKINKEIQSGAGRGGGKVKCVS